MLRHRWLGNAQKSNELANRALLEREKLEDHPALRLGDRVEHIRACSSARHGGIIFPYGHESRESRWPPGSGDRNAPQRSEDLELGPDFERRPNAVWTPLNWSERSADPKHLANVHGPAGSGSGRMSHAARESDDFM